MGTMREREKAFKKEVIAEAAYELLSISPYETVTMDDIAHRAGCGKGTLYQYYANKDEILVNLVIRDLERLCGDIETQCADSPDTIAAMNNYIMLQYQFYLKNNQLFASWLRRRLEQSLPAEWVDQVDLCKQRKIAMVAAIWARGVEEGLFIPIDSVQVANLLENVFRNITYIVDEKKPDPQDMEKLLELMKLLLTRGIYLNRSLQEDAHLSDGD